MQSRISIAGFMDETAVTDFIRRIGDATVESLLYLSSMRGQMPGVAIVQVRGIGKSNRQLYSRYHQYSTLFYLNEAAVEMCRDLRLPLTLLGEVEAMSEEASYDLEAYYLPLAHRPQAAEISLAGRQNADESQS
jgi:hypothetical protein